MEVSLGDLFCFRGIRDCLVLWWEIFKKGAREFQIPNECGASGGCSSRSCPPFRVFPRECRMSNAEVKTACTLPALSFLHHSIFGVRYSIFAPGTRCPPEQSRSMGSGMREPTFSLLEFLVSLAGSRCLCYIAASRNRRGKSAGRHTSSGLEVEARAGCKARGDQRGSSISL